MRSRILRLAVSAAVVLVIPAAIASAQVMTLPRSLLSAPAYEVPDRLLAHRADLALTTEQAAELAALSADLHAQARVQAISSKPWVAAARSVSPEQAFDRALATLTPKQRSRAVQVLASTDELKS